jgi:hypothetical protein
VLSVVAVFYLNAVLVFGGPETIFKLSSARISQMARYAIALLIFVLGIHLAAAEPDEKVHRYTVAAEKVAKTLPGQGRNVVFKHGEMLVTLSEDGMWEAEGPVRHSRFFCGTYQIGARFGTGSPACVNVKWRSDVEYVTSHRQCNSAVMMHKGRGQLAADPAPETPFDIDRVTCAQIYIKCSGTCN